MGTLRISIGYIVTIISLILSGASCQLPQQDNSIPVDYSDGPVDGNGIVDQQNGSRPIGGDQPNPPETPPEDTTPDPGGFSPPDPNPPPEFKSEFSIDFLKCPKTADEGVEYACSLTIAAAEGESFVYSLLLRPKGMGIDPQSGLITWTPSKENKEQEFFDVEVERNGREIAEKRFTVTISWDNDPPEIVSNPSDLELTYPGTNVSLTYKAEDPEGDRLSYTLVKGPDGMQIDDNGVISFTPSDAFINKREAIEISISDGINKVDHSFVLSVKDPFERMAHIQAGDLDFWMDMYENVVIDSADCFVGTMFGRTKSDDDYPEGFPDEVGSEGVTETIILFACSLPGVKPSRNLTLLQAKQACHNVGKRLCAFSEMSAACEGTPSASCNVNEDDTKSAGYKSNCKNNELSSVFDLLGNLQEWTSTVECNPLDAGGNAQLCMQECAMAMEKSWCSANINTLYADVAKDVDGPIVFGGRYDSGPLGDGACGYYNKTASLSSRNDTGFRCCRDN